MMPRRTVKTKQPSGSSTGSSIDQKKPTKFMKPERPKKKATIIGSKSGSSQSATKRMNKSAKQSSTRPGLTTSKATTG